MYGHIQYEYICGMHTDMYAWQVNTHSQVLQKKRILSTCTNIYSVKKKKYEHKHTSLFRQTNKLLILENKSKFKCTSINQINIYRSKSILPKDYTEYLINNLQWKCLEKYNSASVCMNLSSSREKPLDTFAS